MPALPGVPFPGAQAVRVHLREFLGPEVAARLCVGWKAPFDASAYWAYGGAGEPYRPQAGHTELSHTLLSDRQVVLRRLTSAFGTELDSDDVVSSVGAFNGGRRAGSAPDRAATWITTAGKDPGHPDLVLAVGARQLKRGRRNSSSAGPSASDLGSALKQIAVAARSRGRT